MTSPDPLVAAVNALLESCEALSIEPHLRPYHTAWRVPPAGSLEDALVDAIETLYGHRPGRLTLRDAGNWKDALAGAYLFWAGFVPELHSPPPEFEREEHRALLAGLVGAFNEMMALDACAWWLVGEDVDGRALCPSGGLHQYLVVADGQRRVMVDLCWDS